jgi:hypothetical protein
MRDFLGGDLACEEHRQPLFRNDASFQTRHSQLAQNSFPASVEGSANQWMWAA